MAIDRWANLEEDEYARMREAARNYAQRYLDSSGAIEQNRKIFESALQSELE